MGLTSYMVVMGLDGQEVAGEITQMGPVVMHGDLGTGGKCGDVTRG